MEDTPKKKFEPTFNDHKKETPCFHKNSEIMKRKHTEGESFIQKYPEKLLENKPTKLFPRISDSF